MQKGYQFYLPISVAASTTEVIQYAEANLDFFSGEWLSQFIPSTANSDLWPAQIIASILIQLKEANAAATADKHLIDVYMDIYKRLTLKKFTSNYGKD